MNEIQEATRDMLWSLWSELGIPGGGRRHWHLLLDPEPLIVYTPYLVRGDSRLLSLVFDWCVAHSDLLFKSRIASIARESTPQVQRSLSGFNGALLRHGVQWSPRAEPDALTVSRKVVAMPLERPSLRRLRMRTLTGVSVRAEVLTLLLCAGGTSMTVGGMTAAGCSRRSVERVVAELVQGGFLSVHGKQRGRQFALQDPQALSRLLGSVSSDQPCQIIDWHLVLSEVVQIAALEECRDLSDGIRRVAAVKARESLARIMNALQQREPPDLRGCDDAFERLTAWGSTTLVAWANGQMTGQSVAPDGGG